MITLPQTQSDHWKRPFRPIGFDNREICAHITPALSTMALPLRKMGTIAADCLIQKIEHPEPSHQDEYKIPCEILKRKSVCRL